ncbi:hypothetical protein H0H92_011859 [Tricholoma furcatifolium]|nr:hypothetical protein H0H92_011859 [Tricholoma furcatifolium]
MSSERGLESGSRARTHPLVMGVLRHILFLAVNLTFFACLITANDFAGANSYFLYTLSASDRAAVLDAMQAAEMKCMDRQIACLGRFTELVIVLRIFITQVAAGAKGSSAVVVNDLETVAVGTYDDTILGLIDVLASEAHSRDIKLVIAMHDRYALGCWGTDAYVAKYDLPTTDCVSGVPDSSIFYTNASAIADYDNRLRHILNYQSSNFGIPWHQLSDAIFAFEIENEGLCCNGIVFQSEADTGMKQWDTWTRSLPTGVNNPILGADEQIPFVLCWEVMIVAIHDYDIDPTYVATNIDAVKPTALSSGKRLLYEEFGAMGDTKQSAIQNVTDTLISTGVPWMYWEIMKPGQGAANYEVWTDEPSWSTLQSQSIATRAHVGEFGWPEIDGGD